MHVLLGRAELRVTQKLLHHHRWNRPLISAKRGECVPPMSLET
jgi:hypothetical protein